VPSSSWYWCWRFVSSRPILNLVEDNNVQVQHKHFVHTLCLSFFC
jgi:hypothetical protein